METTKPDEKLKEVFKGTSFEDYQYQGFESADQVIESLQTQISEEEVIYYSNAIKYLAENDASLKESLGIASELGYSLENLSSEILATLLQQRNLEEELQGLTDDIEEVFEESN